MCEACVFVWGWEQVCVHNHIYTIKFSPQANEITYLSKSNLGHIEYFLGTKLHDEDKAANNAERVPALQVLRI